MARNDSQWRIYTPTHTQTCVVACDIVCLRVSLCACVYQHIHGSMWLQIKTSLLIYDVAFWSFYVRILCHCMQKHWIVCLYLNLLSLCTYVCVCSLVFLHERVCKCIRVLSGNIFSLITEEKIKINYVLFYVIWTCIFRNYVFILIKL